MYPNIPHKSIGFQSRSDWCGRMGQGTTFAAVPGGILRENYYPGLALYNCSTGALQPRSVVNQIISAHMHVGVDTVLGSAASTAAVYALTLESPNGLRKALLVNKRNSDVTFELRPLLNGSATAWVVDATYAHQPSPRVESGVSGSLRLPAFATAVLVQSLAVA